MAVVPKRHRMQRKLTKTHPFVAICGAVSLFLANCASPTTPHLESYYYPHCAEPLFQMRERNRAASGIGYAKMNQMANENTRLASIRVAANQNLGKANSLQLYAYECISCYTREFDGLQADYEDGLLSKEEYIERFREIHWAMVALSETIGQMDDDIQRMEHEFNETIARYPDRVNPRRPAR